MQPFKITKVNDMYLIMLIVSELTKITHVEYSSNMA